MAPEEQDEEESSGEDEELTPRQFVIQLARDLLVAAAIVGIAVGLVFAYTGNWPPMVVVESDSMQHSRTRSNLGVIDTGDLVLVQSVSTRSDVVTYVEGRSSGYETYANYGDVIIFHEPGRPTEATPIIHRPIVYVEFPSALGPYVDIPSLAGFPDPWSARDWNNNPTTNTTNLRSVTIPVRSWNAGNETRLLVTYNLAGATTSGFLTKGDHNPTPDGWGPVSVTRIVGRARGELPWFGLIKLTIWPTSSGCCPYGWGSTGSRGAPRNSWDSLATSLILIPLGIFLADYVLAFVERYWKSFRKRREERAGGAQANGGGADPPGGGPR